MATKKPVKRKPARKSAPATKAPNPKNSGNKVEAPIDNPSKEHKSRVVDARHIKIEAVANGFIIEASNPITFEKHVARDKEEVVKKVKRFLGLK